MSSGIHSPGDGNNVPHQQPSEVSPELEAEIESAFEGFVALPDEELFAAVEALHAFLDALGGRQLHNERMKALAMLPDASTAEEAAELLRPWIRDTLTALLTHMKAAGITGSGIWVYHAGGGFKMWTIGTKAH